MGSNTRFTIIGDRIENSIEIPIWEKIMFVSDSQELQMSKTDLNHMKANNAIAVFDKFYQDNFIK